MIRHSRENSTPRGGAEFILSFRAHFTTGAGDKPPRYTEGSRTNIPSFP